MPAGSQPVWQFNLRTRAARTADAVAPGERRVPQRATLRVQAQSPQGQRVARRQHRAIRRLDDQRLGRLACYGEMRLLLRGVNLRFD